MDIREIFAVLTLGLALWPGIASAQNREVESERFRDWELLRKADTGQCALSISVGLAQVDSGLATINILMREGGGDIPAVMTIKVPLGVSLSSGLAYTHPNSQETVGFAWQYCTEETCLASGGISSGEVLKLKRGQRIFLGFRPLPNSRPIIIPISLLGFTKGWNALQVCR